jgi:hypothetical protein
MMQYQPSSLLILLSALAAFACCGCQALSPEGRKNWFGLAPNVKESQYATPVKMATMWTPAVLNRAGQPPTRGFGGRLYFYDASNRPVPVEGQLVVYAYNDSKPGASGKTPDAKYAFTPEQFTTHYSPTELGASYSIWIPWDQVGQPQMEISLVPIFTSASGQLVMGQSSRSLLAGPTSQLSEPGPIQRGTLSAPEIRRDDGVQAASFQQNAAVPSQAPSGRLGVETLSLRLPTSMADRLAQAGPQMTLKQQRAQAANPTAPTSAGQRAPTIGPPQTPGAVPPPWFPLNPPLVRSELPRLPVPNVPGSPQAGGQPQTQPFPAGLPSSLPATH